MALAYAKLITNASNSCLHDGHNEAAGPGHLKEPSCNCLQAIHENFSQFHGRVSIRLPRNVPQGWKLHLSSEYQRHADCQQGGCDIAVEIRSRLA